MNTAEESNNHDVGPSSNGNGHKMHFDILKEAQDQGIAKSFRVIARKLKVSPTTLSNIVHGRSSGSAQTRRKIERLFGKPLEKLGDGSAPASRTKRGRKPKIAQEQSTAPAETPEATSAPQLDLSMKDAYEIAAHFNPSIREAARATLQEVLDKL